MDILEEIIILLIRVMKSSGHQRFRTLLFDLRQSDIWREM